MAFTDKQAALRAKQIHHDVGRLIHDACAGTGVQESFLAGFTGVEAAFSKDGPKLDSKRFEIGVYQDLISLRDRGYCYIDGKKRSTYNKVTRAMIADASDAAVKNLSTSWGCTQIMGYWGLVLGCTVAELRDPDKHFHYAIQLLKIVSGHYLMQGDLASVLHVWNTGSANGKTYHEDYVVNALKVKAAYDKLVSAAETSKSEGLATIPVSPTPGDQTNAADGDTPPTTGTVETTTFQTEDGSGQAQTVTQSPNVAIGSEEQVGFLRKIKLELAAWVTWLGGLTGINEYKHQIDELGLPGWLILYAILISIGLALIWLIYRFVTHCLEWWAKRKRTDTLAIVNSTATNSVVIVPHDQLDQYEKAGWIVIRRGPDATPPTTGGQQ